MPSENYKELPRRLASKKGAAPQALGGLALFVALGLAAGPVWAAPPLEDLPKAPTNQKAEPALSPVAEPSLRPVAGAALRRVALAATGDLNGMVSSGALGTAGRPRGLAHLAGAIGRLRREYPRLVLLDGGDSLAGHPRGLELAGGQEPPPLLRLMNRLGYQAAVWGNRDFELGQPALRRLAGQAAFPFLGANTQWEGAAPLPPTLLLEVDGVRLGLVGLTSPLAAIAAQTIPPALAAPTGPSALQPVFTPLEEAARHWAAQLRRQQGADLVVALAHAGTKGQNGRQEALALGLPGYHLAGRLADMETPPDERLDLVVAAHAHRLAAEGAPLRRTPLLQAGSEGDGLAAAVFKLAPRPGGGWRPVETRLFTLRAAPRPDPAMLALAQPELAAQAARWSRPSGYRLARPRSKAQWWRCWGELGHQALQREGASISQLALVPLPAWPGRKALAGGQAKFGGQPQAGGRTQPGGKKGRTGLPLSWGWLADTWPYQTRLAPARLTGRQLELLLDGYRRAQAGKKPLEGEALYYPGGLTQGREEGWMANGEPLKPHASYAVWLDDRLLRGTGGGWQALAGPEQRLELKGERAVKPPDLRLLWWRALSGPGPLPQGCGFIRPGGR